METVQNYAFLVLQIKMGLGYEIVIATQMLRDTVGE